MSNSAFAKFKHKAAASEGVFLRPSEIKDTQAFRVIPWVHNKKITPIHFFYEGWVAGAKAKDKAKPVRFEINDEGGYDADEDIVWARGDFGLQKPKPCFAFVVADFETEKVRILSGTQKTLLGPLSDLCDDESKRFIKDWSAYNILITRDAKTEKFTVEREKLDQEDRGFPKWLTDELEEFEFSLDLFMKGEKMEEGDGLKYRDILDMIGDKPSETTRETSETKEDRKTENKQESFEVVQDWVKVTTPKGVILGKCTKEELLEMRDILDRSKKTDKEGRLYRSILTGILAYNKEDGDAGFEDDDIPF